MGEEKLANFDDVESMDVEDSKTVEVEESTSNFKVPQKVKKKKQVYLPGKPLAEDEELVHDPSAYIMLHEAQTGAPCLSFDVIPDTYGYNREAFPFTAFYVGGTQAERPNGNSLIVMKISNLTKTFKSESESESSSSSEDEFDEEEGGGGKSFKHPIMKTALIKHHGCIDRIRCTKIEDQIVAAVWSEMGKVTLVDLSPQLAQLNNSSENSAAKKRGVGEPIKPLYVFTGHQTEGFAVDWSETTPGMLATGDCRRNIHVWTPAKGSWQVDQRPLVGHTSSVEDIQWSPTEPSVMASCSVDKSIRIWDTRVAGSKACKLVVENAHLADVNVISWNKKEPLIVSGGDDGVIHVWDLRQFKTGNAVASLKHHTEAITTVEWNPIESSIFASGGADDQITIWDLAAERDPDSEVSDELKGLPQQLLFIHQGQNEIKELHWHPQIPGFITSTANSGFNFFRTISV